MSKKFRRFSEYLSNNGKLDKVKIDPSGDTAPEGDKTPQAAQTKGKGWEAQVKSTDKPKPYMPDEKPVGMNYSLRPKGEKDGKSFADAGDKKLIYEPETPRDFGNGGKKVNSWPKTTKEFLDLTQGMTLSEFATFVSDGNKIGISEVPSIDGCTLSSDPTIAAQYAGALATANEGVMVTLIREMKRLGGLPKLVQEILKHSESYNEIAAMIGKNAIVSQRLEHAIKEVVDAPASDTEESEKEEEKLVKGRKNPKTIDNEKVDMAGSNVMASKSKK